jgi:hypothetical protein
MIHEYLLIVNADCATTWKGEVRGSRKKRTLPVCVDRRSTPWLIAAFIGKHMPSDAIDAKADWRSDWS